MLQRSLWSVSACTYVIIIITNLHPCYGQLTTLVAAVASTVSSRTCIPSICELLSGHLLLLSQDVICGDSMFASQLMLQLIVLNTLPSCSKQFACVGYVEAGADMPHV